MANKLLLIFTLALFFSFACSSNTKREQDNIEILKMSTKNRPEWVEKGISKDNENLFFTEDTQVENNELNGLRIARSNLVKTIQVKIKEYLNSYLLERIKKKEMEKIIDDCHVELINIMDINNIIPDATYYEKIKESEKEYFNCYVHKIISFKILDKKITETLGILKSKYKDDKSLLDILLKL